MAATAARYARLKSTALTTFVTLHHDERPEQVTALVVAGAAVLWAAVLPAAAYAATRPGDVAQLFAFAVYGFSGAICHQRAERSFHLLTVPLPVCARCTGHLCRRGGRGDRLRLALAPARRAHRPSTPVAIRRETAAGRRRPSTCRLARIRVDHRRRALERARALEPGSSWEAPSRTSFWLRSIQQGKLPVRAGRRRGKSADRCARALVRRGVGNPWSRSSLAGPPRQGSRVPGRPPFDVCHRAGPLGPAVPVRFQPAARRRWRPSPISGSACRMSSPARSGPVLETSARSPTSTATPSSSSPDCSTCWSSSTRTTSPSAASNGQPPAPARGVRLLRVAGLRRPRQGSIRAISCGSAGCCSPDSSGQPSFSAG